MSTTTVMYTDIEASSAILSEIGDAAYAELFGRHVDMIRRAVSAQHGHVAKLLGDGVLAQFDSAYSAVRAAVTVQQSVEQGAGADGHRLAVRVGMAVGEVVEVDDEMYGATLVIARRLCDAAARPGEIVVTDVIHSLLGGRRDIPFESVGITTLKGVDQPVHAWRVPWDPLPTEVALRVVVADDAPLIRSGIVMLLRSFGFDVIAEVGDADALVAAVDLDVPDLVITDIRMPPTNTDEGLRAAAQIRSRHPQVAVLVLSQYVEASRAGDLLDGGAGVGYLLKERVSDIDAFVEACRAVASGGSVIDPMIGEQLIDRHRSTSAISSLSPRERDTLALMARGRSNQAIASELFVSGKTVETHVRSIFQKLDLVEAPDDHRRVRAVLQWLEDAPNDHEW